ncbi:MAG: addiction module toxin RelE [Pseudopedobacter saltans]|uniref:Addiction module toxin RelE n=1 Tax=Pseudopedobacter saltans TaxID=151895 RepID=A0A2W5GXD0_9SPHI|nr:MAG: addiction module toxin RelE [Pseudopedobacter saltans]
MKILVNRTILYYIDKYPSAAKSLQAWVGEFSTLDALNFNQIKAIYGNASIVANNRVVFNIKGNDFRLVISVNFIQKASYVIWFGTHSEYDKINVATVAYDKKINDFKSK